MTTRHRLSITINNSKRGAAQTINVAAIDMKINRVITKCSEMLFTTEVEAVVIPC